MQQLLPCRDDPHKHLREKGNNVKGMKNEEWVVKWHDEQKVEWLALKFQIRLSPLHTRTRDLDLMQYPT